MAIEIVWSPQALEDLEETAHYIARDSDFYAKAIVSKAINAAQSLDLFPMRGRMVPELGEETLREQFIYSYRLLYRIKERQIVIIALIHGKRLLENITDRFDETS